VSVMIVEKTSAESVAIGIGAAPDEKEFRYA
jgi:hypothetical protein